MKRDQQLQMFEVFVHRALPASTLYNVKTTTRHSQQFFPLCIASATRRMTAVHGAFTCSSERARCRKLRLRRMPTSQNPVTSHLDCDLVIQPQRLNSRPS